MSDDIVVREDWCVEIAAETAEGFKVGSVELRPGADDEAIRVKTPGGYEMEVEIAILERGIARVREEHTR